MFVYSNCDNNNVIVLELEIPKPHILAKRPKDLKVGEYAEIENKNNQEHARYS